MSEDPEGRDGFAQYRELLAQHGFRPSRRLGQNFLLDPSLHRVIADALDPQPDDLVLEIGPGLGFLTRELASRCRVLAVEVDARLVAVLRQEIPRMAGGEQVELLHADALARNRLNPDVAAALAVARKAVKGRLFVIANLPYAIAGPLLAELVLLEEPPDAMALLIQYEMARRIAGQPGTRDFGALTAQIQAVYEARVLRKVGAQVFRPRPQVDSAIIRLTARGDRALRDAEARRAFGAFLRGLFASRRKKLRNAKVLADVQLEGPWEGEFAELLERRPDALTVEELLALFRRVHGGPVDAG